MISVHYIYTPRQSRVTAVCRHAPCPRIFSPASSGSFPMSRLIAVCPVFWSPVNRLDWQPSVILCQGTTSDIYPHFSVSSSHLLNPEILFQEQQLQSSHKLYKFYYTHTYNLTVQQPIHPSPDQDFKMALWRWRPMRGSSVHQHVPKGAHWLSKQVWMTSLVWESGSPFLVFSALLPLQRSTDQLCFFLVV